MASLAAIEAAPPAIPVGFIAVPLSTLRVAKAQFESLAAAFEKSGNIVSQVRCEASALHLDRVITDSGAADDAEDRSQHAAWVQTGCGVDAARDPDLPTF